MSKPMLRVVERDNIRRLIEDKSSTMTDYITKNQSSRFILHYKYLTHSDLPTFGKATRRNKLSKNLLYYLSVDEMNEIQENANKVFETAHQSNIGVSGQFWVDLEMPNPRVNVDKSDENRLINNFANVFLVNDSLRYFTHNYTSKVFEKLNKQPHNKNEWSKFNTEILVNNSDLFTEIILTQKVHGLGCSEDLEFRKLRHHLFKNDIIMLLIEIKKDSKNLFIIPYKNPKFFTIVNETNNFWEKYIQLENSRQERIVSEKQIDVDYISRNQQDKWRTLLAEEMMNYTINDNEVFCPITMISAPFDNVGTLFRASHIKSFSESQDTEKYDINNGLLLVANADALFDKHMITIGDDKKLIFSFLIDQNHLLKTKLQLNNDIFREVLNAERMKYIAYHREVFHNKEKLRKKGGVVY